MERKMNSVTQITNEAKEKARRKKFTYATIISMVATSLMAITTPLASAAVAISLGQANNFAVLAGGGISNTGATTIQGDIGLYPTVNYADSGTVSLTGSYHFGDTTAIRAKVDLATAYTLAVAAAPASVSTGDLGGQTLVPGIYVNPTGLVVTGTLTLDAQGNSNAVFILQTPAALNTASSSQINIVNGGQACNVFWQVGSTTSLGANSDFKGTILTNSNFAGGANARVLGRILSIGGSVALNANSIIKPSCINNKTEWNVGTQRQAESRVAISGAGSYLSPYGKASFNLLIKTAISSFDTSTVVSGKVGWMVPKQWKFQGALNTYSSVNGVGTATGSGVLYTWNRSGHKGKWAVVTTGATNVMVKFTVPTSANSNKSRTITGFAIGFSGAVVAGAPTLPVLGPLVVISKGQNSDNN